MKTIVAAFPDIRLMNNYESVNSEVGEDGVRIMVHNQPLIFQSGSSVTRNYDIVITNKESEDDPDRTVVLPRYRKTTQQGMIRSYAERNSFKNYYHPKTWCSDIGAASDDRLKGSSSGYVVKYDGGARGILQYLLTPSTDEELTARHVFRDLNRMIGARCKEFADIKNGKDFMMKACAGFFKEFKVHASGFEEKDQITADYAFSKTKSWYVQEYVQNIIAEYRIIYCRETKDIIIVRRDIKAGIYPQAIGSLRISESQSRIPELTDEAFSELMSLLENVIPSCNSVDVFIKQDPGQDVKFGIFEFSNQFGTVGLRSKQINDLQKNFIVAMYKSLVGNF